MKHPISVSIKPAAAQYVTFAAGGNSILLPKVSDQVISFALPH